MHTPIRQSYSLRKHLVNQNKPWVATKSNFKDHQDRINYELKSLGVSSMGLKTMESHYLPHIIHQDEHLGGVVYGQHPNGFAMLIATDRRIIFLDKKPFLENQDDITYDVVSGISFGHAGFGSSVTLHTRLKDYPIKTFNQKCAHNFVEYIEARCLEHKNNRNNYYD